MVIKSFADPRADAFRLEIRKWAAGAVTPEFASVHEMTETQQLDIRRAWDRKLFEAGYAGLSWPREFGGRGEGMILETILFEELAAARAPEGLGRIGRVMAGPLIMAEGTDDQRRRLLPPILSGENIWCLGFSEPGAGSDLPALTTRARRDGDGYRIKGRKIWTSHAHYADRCVLLARSGSDQSTDISIFLLDMHQQGINVSPIKTSAGDHHFNEVTFDDAFVHETDRLGDENDGWRIFRAALSFERGGGVALFHYLEMRHQCDVLNECCTKGAAVPGAAGRALSLRTAVELVRWHVMRSVEMEANGRSAKSVQNVLKLYFSELWQQVTAFGLSCGCEQHKQLWQYQYLRSRAGTIYSGTSEIQRNTIARRLISDMN